MEFLITLKAKNYLLNMASDRIGVQSHPDHPLNAVGTLKAADPYRTRLTFNVRKVMGVGGVMVG